MTDTTFIAIEQGTLLSNVPEQFSWFALGRESRRPLSGDLKIASSAKSEAGAFLFPIGDAGQLLWKDLPLSLARLAAPPWHSAIYVIPRELLRQRPTADELRREFAEADESLKVGDLLDAPTVPEELPLLAPPFSEIPDWLAERIRDITAVRKKSSIEQTALRAGLLQVHDQLNESHTCSQAIEGQGRHRNGDYWHAIMHRREPDYGNSKYWFRRVGEHPVFPLLAGHAARVLEKTADPAVERWKERLAQNRWDPFAFVDFCQQAAQNEATPLGIAARQIQWIEMLLLLRQTWADATA